MVDNFFTYEPSTKRHNAKAKAKPKSFQRHGKGKAKSRSIHNFAHYNFKKCVSLTGKYETTRSTKINYESKAVFFLLTQTVMNGAKRAQLRPSHKKKIRCWCCFRQFTVCPNSADDMFHIFSEKGNDISEDGKKLEVAHDKAYSLIDEHDVTLGKNGYSTANCTLMCGDCNRVQKQLSNHDFATSMSKEFGCNIEPPKLRPLNYTIVYNKKMWVITPSTELKVCQNIVNYLNRTQN